MRSPAAHVETSSSARGALLPRMLALLTRMLRSGKRERADSTSLLDCSGSPTSAAANATAGPIFWSSDPTRTACSSPRAHKKTRAPCFKKAVLMPSPIPLLAPVMSAPWPASRSLVMIAFYGQLVRASRLNWEELARSDGPRYASSVKLMAATPTLSVVLPVFNEEASIEELHRRLLAALEPLRQSFEVIYVDDGSSDRSRDLVCGLAERDPRVGVLVLSRNFGHQVALSAGVDHARGDAVVLMDSDLQDPPELIPELVRRWKEGFDVVYAQRRARQGESIFKRAIVYIFYRMGCPVATP